MAINVSKSNLNQAAKFLQQQFKAADANKTGQISKKEIAAFDGQGKAAMQKVFAYAQHIEGYGEKDGFVKMSNIKQAIQQAASGVTTAANTKGDKDGKLDGNEMKHLSNAGAALVRLAHSLND